MRPSGRSPDALRPVAMEIGVSKHAEGSCLIHMGDTKVLCTASVDDRVPGWLKGGGRGWVTAEYGMLPRATNTRTDREAARGKQSGRTQEIQRLIGRALRAGVDLAAFGELVIKVDCDVLQADGGTRCASITGGYVALVEAVRHLERIKAISGNPMQGQIAAVSCGLYNQTPVLDLDYDEDSAADADANFVMTGGAALVEVQGTAEGDPFTRDQFTALMDLAEKGVAELCAAQRSVLGL